MNHCPEVLLQPLKYSTAPPPMDRSSSSSSSSDRPVSLSSSFAPNPLNNKANATPPSIAPLSIASTVAQSSPNVEPPNDRKFPNYGKLVLVNVGLVFAFIFHKIWLVVCFPFNLLWPLHTPLLASRHPLVNLSDTARRLLVCIFAPPRPNPGGEHPSLLGLLLWFPPALK